MSTCTHCGGPITGAGHAGHAGAAYCCLGCLDRGEGTCGPSCAPQLGGTGLRLGVGILVVGQSMVFGLALNLHDDVPSQARALTQWMILAGTALVALLLGGPIVRTAWAELRRGRLTIEAMFLLTMAGAIAASLQAHITGRGKIYFEVVSVLLVVYTLGKLIGSRAREKALMNSRAWGDSLCLCRLVNEAGGTRTAPVAEVSLGDVIEVYPGETIAIDGVIRAGVGFVAEAAVSGEPFAVVRRPGDRVLAGSASFDATFRITATAKGTERQVDRLLVAVEAARDKPLSLQTRADRLGQWFLPLVVCVALGTFAYWTHAEGWETGLFHAMSVLLVACPCVIGLATPVVIWSALERLAERGVLVRGGDAIEKLATVDRVMFDKTGTLTEDRFTLVDIETTATGPDRETLLGWLSLVQSQSSHPVAKPFADLPRPFVPGTEPRVRSLVAVPGCGVIAELEEANGARHEIRIGTPEWLSSVSREPQASEHVIHVALDGELAAFARVAERLRDSAPRAIAHFAQLGLPVEVLTGDAPARAASLGLPARANLLPADKRAAIEGGKTLFVGDGINDAGALAAAHVGVSLASGTDLAVIAAPVTLYTSDLRTLPWAVEVSRDAVRAVRRNLARALAYNLVGMTLAACGVLHPIVAALLMVVSSLSLLFSAARVGDASGVRKPTDTAESQATRTGIRGLTPPARLALAHALAFALQGIAFMLLLPALPLATLIAFALVGVAVAGAWHRCVIPHWLDMCFGMLTLGNLGMLVGWWVDNGFAPLACTHCACTTSMKSWMWVGMLLFANAAMLWLGRGSVTSRCHSLAMHTGGNAGMVLGMLAGGAFVARFAIPDLFVAVAVSFTGMTVGMLAGMLAGTWLAERAFTSSRIA